MATHPATVGGTGRSAERQVRNPDGRRAGGRGGSLIVRYSGTVVFLAASGLVALWFWRERLGEATARGASVGLGLATAGAVAAMILTAWAFGRNQQKFFAALMLGILGRLALYCGALLYVGLRTSLQPQAMAVAMLGSYVVFQVLELRFAVKGLKRGRG